MNWKEFFKPTKGKITITLLGILIEIYAFSPFSGCYITGKGGGSCNKFLYYISKPFYQLLERIGDFNVILMIILGILLFTIVFYLLGCLIIFIYEKFKKQNEPNLQS